MTTTFYELMRFFTIIMTFLLLSSCSSPTVGVRKRVAEEYGVSSERLSHIESKWRNSPRVTHSGTPMLWETLTSKESTPSNAVVELEMSDDRTLVATLLVNDLETDSHIIKFKKRASWIELPTRQIARPFLWYLVWGWGQSDPALGIDANGDLWVNTIDNGSIMVLVVPVFSAGGGKGTVNLFERLGNQNMIGITK